MKNKFETMEFREGPLAELIWELNDEVNKWCRKNCPEVKGFFAKLLNPRADLPCFGGAVYHLEQIEECTKIPKLYKLYWRAKGNIIGLAPVIICKEKK